MIAAASFGLRRSGTFATATSGAAYWAASVRHGPPWPLPVNAPKSIFQNSILYRAANSVGSPTPQKEEVPEKEAPETAADSPLPDLRRGRQEALPLRQEARLRHPWSDQLGLALGGGQFPGDRGRPRRRDRGDRTERAWRQRNGKDESTEPEMQNEGGEIVELKRPAPAKGKSSELSARTDDPVRMYLREMGSVELLSR
jgi:Sigma-70 factor, region 1.2